MSKAVNSAIFLIAVYAILTTINSYIFYFIGMTISILTSPILNVEGHTVAYVFYWIGILSTTIVAITLFAVGIISGLSKGGK